jgi:dTDP-4-amino-4,6-dideoxygalactose transaminase
MSPTDKRFMELPQEWPGAHYYDDAETEAVLRLIRSHSLFRFYGPDHQNEASLFEKELAGYIGARYCLGVSQGTAALQVALAAMGVGPGDEVLLPGYFWVSTVSAVIRSGAIPRLVDVDESFSMDPDDLESRISVRTKAVIIVHMGGVIGQVERIAGICRKHNLLLLEDCAQAAGASLRGKKAGAFGDMAIFSFQLNKNMTAGEGGAVVTDSEALYKKAFAVHDLGYFRNDDGRLDTEQADGQLWGIGCRMNEMIAAILRVQLKKLDSITGSMRAFKNELKAMLPGFGAGSRHVEDPEGDAGAFLKIIFNDKPTSTAFLEALASCGIRVRQGGFYPVHMTDWGLHIYYNIPSLVNKRSICGHHSVWELEANRWAKDYSYSKGSLPVLDSYIERTVIFCIASKLSAGEKEFIGEAFRNSLAQVQK